MYENLRLDIAGPVAGASKGEGLGNQFLANIRETDAIAHVVRCFVDENVVLRDLEGLSTEEASRVLKVKTQTLKSRLHRGRLIA